MEFSFIVAEKNLVVWIPWLLVLCFEFVNIANTVSDVNIVIILYFLNLVNTVNYCIDYTKNDWSE